MQVVTNKDIEKLCRHCPESAKPQKPFIKMQRISIDAEVHDKVVALGQNPSCLFCLEVHRMTKEFAEISKTRKA